jgi:regulatory protein YycH of two-component signal transduction system YycFG
MAWIERVKTISLVILVILSIILTGLLWYSTPSYEEQSDVDYTLPPYIAKDNYVKKNLYSLNSPPFLVSHISGNHQLITEQQGTIFSTLIRDVHRTSLDNFQLITPTTDEWNMLYQQASGLELSFFHDIPIEQLDALFFQYLNNEPIFHDITAISRVWLYENPDTGKSNIWFISDKEGKIIQATITNLAVKEWSKKVDIIKNAPSYLSLEAIPINGRNPWDKVNEGVPFSRVLYLPSQAVATEQVRYTTQPITIENMKEWLFQGADIQPIDLSKNESVFMDNDQILTHYKQGSYMVYTDNTRTDGETNPISTQIDLINTKFMDKHRGWTGNYVLEKIADQDGNHLYTFRLIQKNLPVFWRDGEPNTTYLDTIQLQSGPSISSVSKYKRSLLYLSKQPYKQVPSSLPGKPIILAELSKKNIPLTTIQRIYPIYLANNLQHGEVILTPCWLVELTNGETLQIGGVS